jgi:Arc/MetJ-type ribon-helix-helix transcriptional regulator
MAYQFPPDVDKLVRDHMATGGYASEDDVLREALLAFGEFARCPDEVDEEYRQAVAAVQEGMADAEAGRMRPLRDIIDEARGNRPVEAE